MAKIEKSIDSEVPARTAYNQWTQFEDFPRFMEGVEKVEQLDDKLGLVERRIEGDLRRFKEFIEARGRETGAWHGEVRQEG